MDLTWLGTAGFIVRDRGQEIAFDPFLSRGQGEPSPFTTKSFGNTQAIFVGHGHFDHVYDVPAISKESSAQIFAPGLTGHILKLRGLPSKKLKTAHNQESLFRPFSLRAYRSGHVKFDLPLVLSTIKRCGVRGCLNAACVGLGWPQGLVQTYYFEIRGKKFLYASSAGLSMKELLEYRKLEVDYFLAPLQGHSKIQKLAAMLTATIKPKTVIPHHHDDFYPPLSQAISIDVFRSQLKSQGFDGDLLEIPLFKNVQL